MQYQLFLLIVFSLGFGHIQTYRAAAHLVLLATLFQSCFPCSDAVQQFALCMKASSLDLRTLHGGPAGEKRKEENNAFEVELTRKRENR